MKHWIVLALLIGWFNTSQAQTDISDFFKTLKTFSADFKQSVRQDGQLIQQSAGVLALKKPLKFRWNYLSPDPMQLVSDGKKFYHYDVDLAQVTVKPVVEIASSALITLMSDKEPLDALFHIQKLTQQKAKTHFGEQAAHWLESAQQLYWLQAEQKNTDDVQASDIVIGLTEASQLSLLYAKDTYGENTFFFENQEQNQRISNSVFRFKAPKGVDVLGE